MINLLWVSVGGAVGSALRYLLSSALAAWLGGAFPYGTLAVNLIGSCLIALVMAIAAQSSVISPLMRLALTSGVMGGFTTYSAFSFDTMRALQSGAWGAALINVAATLVGCLVACFIGWSAGRWLIAL